MLGEIFEPFVNKSPVSVMARGLAERILQPERLDAWFEDLDTPQYTRDLLFSSVFNLMSQVVCGSQKSVNAAYQAAKDEVGTSIVSVYNKLMCLDINTSAGLVRYAADEAIPIIEQLGGALPPLLPGYRVKLLDGNCIEASEHRIKELRTLAAGALPGKSLVVLDPALHLPIAVFPCEDGHAQERSLLGGVLKTVAPRDVWVADRNFCTLSFLLGIALVGGFFAIREHKNLPWKAISDLRPAGKTDTGRLFEQKIQITDEQGNTLKLRRIVLRLKKVTRDGDKEIVILTNLSKRAAQARQIATLYRNRWTIETAFQELTVHLNSEINTLGYPRAALFAFCVALVAYIIMAILKAALRSVHGTKTIEDNFSGYYLADELSGVYQGMMISIPAHEWMIFRQLTQPQLIQCLQMLVGNVKLSRFQKHPRGPKKPAPKRISDPKTPHVSTAKLLARRKS
ncbi:MAG: IS4 family transposase [Ketobacter sp.]|nr:IS4 family transposase [Ketobacter sp.]